MVIFASFQLSISVIDCVLLAAYLTVVMLLGLWVGRGQRRLADYLLGGRDLPWWAILGSIVATETSTATFLSVPGISFATKTGDMRFLQLTIGYLIGRIIVAYLLLPLYFKGKLFSAYEVLQTHFGLATKRVASGVFLIARNLGDGLRLYLAAIALEQVTKLPLTSCIVIVGVLTIVYTYFGGMKSVVWNDCLQFVVYMVGGCIAFAVILNRLPGGFSEFLEFGQTHEKFRLFDFRFTLTDPYTFCAGVVGGMFLTLGTHGTDQMMVQRYLCARRPRDARRALILSALVVMLQFALFLLIGVGLACFYSAPGMQVPGKGDQAFASFIVDYLPVGVVGITLAAVFAAAMSTLSSSLNSSASAVVNDFLKPEGKFSKDDRRWINISRVFTVVFGVLQIGIGVGAQYVTQNVVGAALGIAGFSAGLLLGLFSLAVWFPRIGQASALVGLLGGLAAVSFVRFGTDVAWPWHAVVGSLATVTCAHFANLVFSSNSNKT